METNVEKNNSENGSNNQAKAIVMATLVSSWAVGLEICGNLIGKTALTTIFFGYGGSFVGAVVGYAISAGINHYILSDTETDSREVSGNHNYMRVQNSDAQTISKIGAMAAAATSSSKMKALPGSLPSDSRDAKLDIGKQF